jgi:oxalate decarboxylase/phosphoglucose isomerase-like protein (cupin superfamily)
MNEHERPGVEQVRVLHAAERSGQQSFFAAKIAGNHVVHFGNIDLGSSLLHMALAETEPGGIFPFQYHRGGMEMALILSGRGVIQVGENEGDRLTYACAQGDIVLIPPALVYRVCNLSPDEPLLAWVFFAEGTRSYWPNGTPA